MKKVNVLLQMMKNNNWYQRDVASLVGCDRSEVGKIIHGSHASWFWQRLLEETGNKDLYIAMLEEKLEEVSKLQEWVQKEKSPRQRAN